MIRQLVIITSIVFVSSSELSSFHERHRRFASDLYSTIIKSNPKQNIVVSPFSVHILASLLYFGAGNTTAEELKNALRLSSNNRTEVSSLVRSVLQDHISDNLQLVNMMCFSESISIIPKFYEIAKKSFKSEINNFVFTDTKKTTSLMNEWIKQKTHDKIKEIVVEDDFDGNTQLVVINAIYFRGDWKQPFETTEKRSFWISKTESKDVTMMTTVALFKTANIPELDADVVQLDYKDSDFSMLVIVPNKLNGLTELENQISYKNFLDLRNDLKEKNFIVSLPKFATEFTTDLEDIFSKLGMLSMFLKSASFGKMVANQDVYVNNAIHKAFFEVTESGTESEPVNFSFFKFYTLEGSIVADHPFMYAVISNSTVLFTGRYVG